MPSSSFQCGISLPRLSLSLLHINFCSKFNKCSKLIPTIKSENEVVKEFCLVTLVC